MQKYLSIKKANTGIDPEGTFKNFIKNDVISNIDVYHPIKPAQSLATFSDSFSPVKPRGASMPGANRAGTSISP